MKLLHSLAVAILLIATVASAQETRSTLTGIVTDSTGAVIPHARIVITDTDTGATTNVTSNGVGEYTVPFLEPGPYKIEVTAPGFKSYLHIGLQL